MVWGIVAQLRERGVLRVAASYAVIAWLVLQIASVVFDPLGVPKWALTALIIAAALGFPVAVALAWFFEIGDDGIRRDSAAAGVARPTVHDFRRYADVAVIGVLLVVVAVLLVKESGFGRPPPPANPAIAVMAFENLSGDPSQEYFSDGLAVEVVDRLGRVPGLRVIASSSSFSYKGKNEDPKTVASQLGVTTLLEGSVRRDGRKLRLNARLIDGVTGQQVWSGSFDRDVTDVFAVQSELASAVIEAIVPAARGEAVAAAPPPTTDLGAHDHYLLGLAGLRSRSSSRLADAVAQLEQAVALDPNYAAAQAALARALVLRAGYDSPAAFAEVRRRAEAAIYKALALDDSSSDAHAALGNLLRQEGSPGAEDEYKRALELNPNNAVAAHDYAVLLSNLPGRLADSRAMGDRALALDPRSAIDWANKLNYALQTGGPASYQSQFARAMQIFDGDPDGLEALALGTSGATPVEALQLSAAIERAGGDRVQALTLSLEPLIALGEYDEALARIDRIKSLGDGGQLGYIPLEMRAAGLKGDAHRLDQVIARPERQKIRPNYRHLADAYWYVVQGRMDEARAALAQAGDFEHNEGGVMGSSLGSGALPAVVRIYSSDGRGQQSRALLARYREWLHEHLAGRSATATDEMMLAEFAMASGDDAGAVQHLRAALKRTPFPGRFYPELPWFRSLQGKPGYDQVLSEFEKRQSEMRARIAQMSKPGAGRAN